MTARTKRNIAALAAAEGTGRAAVMGLNLDDPHTQGAMYEPITESPTRQDPIAACHALIDSIEDDWPGHTFTVIANDRAKYLAWRARMTSMVGRWGTYSPKEYSEALP